VSIKVLFDVAGETTLAGSVVLRDAAPAAADAAIVGRLRRAGAVIVGKTNMSEFAFTILGINPHHGTPRSPWDRAAGRIPGGSSSGAAVSVSDQMAAYAIGTDTGGSVRVPAAFCGLVGFKPTARRVPLSGCFPLSRSLDSIGPIAPTVACCATIDRVLSGEPSPVPVALPVAGLRLGVPRQYVVEGLEPEVAHAFAAALSRLSAAGARVVDLEFPELLDLPAIHKKGSLANIEAYALHRRLIADRAALYDPRVLSRIVVGRIPGSAEYLDLLDQRAAFVATTVRRAAPLDAMVFPTVSMVPPLVSELEASDEAYFKANARALRNTSLVNFFDGCALSIPCHEPGSAPVGFMVVGPPGSDDRLLAAGMAIEATLSEGT
jgi:aspartyl-tRNA(Asn)/glutamyl-tRNA(Gln) amidotransferase subunit A